MNQALDSTTPTLALLWTGRGCRRASAKKRQALIRPANCLYEHKDERISSPLPRAARGLFVLCAPFLFHEKKQDCDHHHMIRNGSVCCSPARRWQGRVRGENREDLSARSQGQARGRAQRYARWHGQEALGLVQGIVELAKDPRSTERI